ncbi:hypothetical protein [Paenibacillus sp.]|uniref:hypothetical protein n=1 Tax=Paenibacillus sp. TaxID=58172 RepID=UPI002D489C87|nr:hypothetical protein [Paenibacillus sp.]HZG87375.1 hypothetical protein [Paenibacillus sp.]
MKWGKTAAAVAAICCGVGIGSMITALANGIPAAGQPGSSEDPVVTKSYVDEQIQRALNGEAVGGTGATVQRLQERIAALEAQLAEAQDAGVPYTVIRLKPGHMLLGEMGTEFIVRTGQAYVHSNPENGVPDLTDGVDLKLDTLIPKNHLLQVPREGRGVKVKADYPNDVYVTVKGAYVEIDAQGNEVTE